MRKPVLNMLIFAAVSLVFVAVCWWLVVPRIRTAQSSLQSKQSQRDEYVARVADLNAAKLKLDSDSLVAGAKLTPAILEETIPPTRDSEDLMAMIENIASSSGINGAVNVAISEKAADGTSTIIDTPVTITTAGSYDSIKKFLETLQTALRPIALHSVDLAPSEKGDINLSLTASAYTRDSSTSATPSASANSASTTSTTPATTPGTSTSLPSSLTNTSSGNVEGSQ